MVKMFFTRAAIQRKECMDNGGLSLLEESATGNSVGIIIIFYIFIFLFLIYIYTKCTYRIII